MLLPFCSVRIELERKNTYSHLQNDQRRFKNLMYICICYGITDSEITEAINNGAHSRMALGETLGAGTCCRRCVPQLDGLLQQATIASSCKAQVTLYQPEAKALSA